MKEAHSLYLKCFKLRHDLRAVFSDKSEFECPAKPQCAIDSDSSWQHWEAISDNEVKAPTPDKPEKNRTNYIL